MIFGRKEFIFGYFDVGLCASNPRHVDLTLFQVKKILEKIFFSSIKVQKLEMPKCRQVDTFLEFHKYSLKLGYDEINCFCVQFGYRGVGF